MYKHFLGMLSFFKHFFKFLSIISLVIAFLIMVYWMAKVTNYGYMDFAAPFFDGILRVSKHIYDGQFKLLSATIELSYFVATGCFVVLNFLFIFIEKFIEKTQSTIVTTTSKVKIYKENSFNQNLKNKFNSEKLNFNGFIVKTGIYTSNKMVTYQQDTIDQRYTDLCMRLKESNITFEKSIFDDTLLLQFYKYDSLDMVVAILKSWFLDIPDMDYITALAPYRIDPTSVKKQIDKVYDLRIKNKIVTTGNLRLKYSLQEHPKYTLVSEGTYLINDKEIEFFSFI